MSALDELKSILAGMNSQQGQPIRLIDASPEAVHQRIVAVQRELDITYSDAAEMVMSDSPAAYERYKSIVLSERAGMTSVEEG